MLLRLFPGALFALAASGLMPLDAAIAANNTCEWGVGTGPIRYIADVKALYVPRDAQIGDPIGPIDQVFIARGSGSIVYCQNDGINRLVFNATNTVPPVPGPILRKNGITPQGYILSTNIPGVGAQISFGSPYDGITQGFWKLNGADSSIPYDAYIDFQTPFPIQHSILRGTVTLIKTGTIGPGQHSLDSGRELVKGAFTGIPDAFGVALSGSVTQAECTLSTNPVSADPVKLGEWESTEFTGEGHTTDAIPFSIALNSCVSDPQQGGTITNAYVRLDPTAGSTTVDASRGVFTLGGTSTAQGVGIQVLGSDALTPVALESDVLYNAIPATGGMLLEFNARYYQTGPSTSVVAGSADGALGFTITYK